MCLFENSWGVVYDLMSLFFLLILVWSTQLNVQFVLWSFCSIGQESFITAWRKLQSLSKSPLFGESGNKSDLGSLPCYLFAVTQEAIVGLEGRKTCPITCTNPKQVWRRLEGISEQEAFQLYMGSPRVGLGESLTHKQLPHIRSSPYWDTLWIS